MIEFVTGNVLEADAEALVNTVNCVGIMGKGIALQFRQAYPDNYEAYRRACQRKELRPGVVQVFETGLLANPKYIINLPTKQHWRGKSKMEDIEAGLAALEVEIRQRRISSVAIPPLGCGSGGLDWSDVQPRIEGALRALTDVRILVFEPGGAPRPDGMRVTTKAPKLTRARAILVALLEEYTVPGYRLTMLEIQKLAYLLQEAGEPLKLRFVKQKYGPYAEALHHVLQRLEGHFLRGYGDRTRYASIRMLPGAGEQAREFLRQETDADAKLTRVAKLIDGFETPYGLELLASVHWVAKGIQDGATEEAIIGLIHEWSKRKRDTFHKKHISKAWQRLQNQGWC